MNSFLLDENLPVSLEIPARAKVVHVRELGESLTDTEIWEYAVKHKMTILTKDTDFCDRVMLSEIVTKVVWFRIGNMRRRNFEQFVGKIWADVERLVGCADLVQVFPDRIEGFRKDA